MYNKKAFRDQLELRKFYIEEAIGKINLLMPKEDSKEIYQELEIISGQIEKTSYDLREILIALHLQLQFEGLKPDYNFLNNPPNVKIFLENDVLILTFDGILPIEPVGGAFYLNGKLEDAILGFRQEKGLTTPLFNNKCGVIFYHHYNIEKTGKRHLRDFDNLEKRTITNVLSRHFMVDDNPLAMVSLDVLLPDKQTYTEVKICSIPVLKELISKLR